MTEPAATPAGDLLRTPLYETHLALSGRMDDTDGWAMPVVYPHGTAAEHEAVRTGCGVFDVSHFGRIHVEGEDALSLAHYVHTRDFTRIGAGSAVYGLFCNQDGGILDDAIASVLSEEDVLFVVNAATRTQDVQWLRQQAMRIGLDARVVDQTIGTALIAVQGPRASATLQPLTDLDLGELASFEIADGDVAGAHALVSRTGYTGEDGFELEVQLDDAEPVWRALTAAGAVPCGMAALDVLRLEAGLPRSGRELGPSNNPYELRLGWAVSTGKGEFIGRAALQAIKQAGPARTLVGLALDGETAAPESATVQADGRAVGQVTSSVFSPSLGRGIALALVEHAAADAPSYQVGAGEQMLAAERVKLPYVPHRRVSPRTR